RGLSSQPADDLRLSRPGVRIGQPQTIALEKSGPQPIAGARPAALTARQIERAQEPDDVDERGPSRRIVEVVETPRILGQCELLDVRVTVQAHDRRTRQI